MAETTAGVTVGSRWLLQDTTPCTSPLGRTPPWALCAWKLASGGSTDSLPKPAGHFCQKEKEGGRVLDLPGNPQRTGCVRPQQEEPQTPRWSHKCTELGENQRTFLQPFSLSSLPFVRSPVTLPTTLSSVWGALLQPLPVDSALGSEVPTPVWQVRTRGTGPTPHTRPQLQAAGRASPHPVAL